jgi:hypothetical protein
MHIIRKLHFRISLKKNFKSEFTIYMHKKVFASYITIHFLQKNLHVA